MMRQHSKAPSRARQAIPEFSLYGEFTGASSAEFVHIELIETRSSLYDWHIDTHRHLGLFQVLSIFQGHVRAQVDDDAWDIDAPAIITVYPSAVHNFVFSPGTYGYVLTIAQSLLFTDAMPNTTGAYEDLLRKPLLFDLSNEEAIATRLHSLLTHILAEFSQPQFGHTHMVEWLMRSVLLLLARLHVQNDSASRSGRTEFDLFMRFRTLVESHYAEQWAVPRYVALLHVTESKLNRVCKRIAGMSAFDIIQDRLMLEARRKLAYVPASVSHIAYELGFQDPAYFCRVFKRHAGLTPSSFRQAMQETHAAQD